MEYSVKNSLWISSDERGLSTNAKSSANLKEVKSKENRTQQHHSKCEKNRQMEILKSVRGKDTVSLKQQQDWKSDGLQNQRIAR